MRQVLLIAHDFPPVASAAAQRARQFARHLPAHGWRPVVVTPRAAVSWAHDPATVDDLPPETEVHPTASLDPGRWVQRLSPTGTRGPSRAGGRSTLARLLREWVLIPDSHAGWIPFATAAALRLAREAAVVLTTSPPTSAHLAGGFAARVANRPWVVDFQDPWSIPGFENWRGWLRPRVDALLEGTVLRRADRVVATTTWLADHLARRGAGDRVEVVANGYEPAEYPEVSSTGPFNRAFTIVHAGSFYGPRSPEPLLAAVARAIQREPNLRPSLRVRLLGSEDAENADRLTGSIRRLGLASVIDRVGQVPRRDALAAMRSASALALVTDPVGGGRGLIPIKLFEYLGAERPILALAPPEGEAGRLVRAARGLVAHPFDVEGAASALLRLFEAWQSRLDAHRPDPKVAGAYQWERLTGRLAWVLDEAAAGAGGARAEPPTDALRKGTA